MTIALSILLFAALIAVWYFRSEAKWLYELATVNAQKITEARAETRDYRICNSHLTEEASNVRIRLKVTENERDFWKRAASGLEGSLRGVTNAYEVRHEDWRKERLRNDELRKILDKAHQHIEKLNALTKKRKKSKLKKS